MASVRAVRTRARSTGAFLTLVGLLVALFAAFAPSAGATTPAPGSTDEAWTGNGGNTCSKFVNDDRGDGWLFILTDPGAGPWSLYAEFDDTGWVGPVAGTQKGKGAVQFWVDADTGDTLLQAFAGPQDLNKNGNLTLSHCTSDEAQDENTLEVSKIVDDNTGTHGDDTFDIWVTCVVDNENWMGIDANGEDDANDGVLKLTFQDGDAPYLITGIPQGATCTVDEQGGNPSYEDDEGDTTDGVVQYPAIVLTTEVCSFTVQECPPPPSIFEDHWVEVTNTFRDVNTLVVTKHVDGNSTQENGDYEVTVVCQWDGPWQGVDDAANVSPSSLIPDKDGDNAALVVDLSDADSVTISNIPFGSTCTVTETDDGGADDVSVVDSDGADDGVVTYQGELQATAVVPPEHHTVDITNSFDNGGGGGGGTRRTTTTTAAPTTTTTVAVQDTVVAPTTVVTAAPTKVEGVVLARTGQHTRDLLILAGLALFVGGLLLVSTDYLPGGAARRE